MEVKMPHKGKNHFVYCKISVFIFWFTSQG